MKKIILIGVLGLILAYVGLVSYRIYKDHRYASIILEDCTNASDNSFDIGIIGDSWVMPKMIDVGLKSELSQIENLRISSFGQGGARSKKILENLYLPEGENFSSNSILKGGYDAVIIIAGVNDVSSYSGKDFYSFHIMKIIEQLEKCQILPIVVSIPEFAIEDLYSERALHRKIWRDIPNRILFDDNITNPRDRYDEALKNELNKSGVKYLYIDFNKFIDDYHQSKNLYSDQSHLNQEGYILLGEFIGREILENLEFVNVNTVATIQLKANSELLHP